MKAIPLAYHPEKYRRQKTTYIRLTIASLFLFLMSMNFWPYLLTNRADSWASQQPEQIVGVILIPFIGALGGATGIIFGVSNTIIAWRNEIRAIKRNFLLEKTVR